MIKTLADLKRALQTEGVKVETLALATNVRPGRLRVGMIRYVNKYDTTGVYLKESPEEEGRGSFLGYDKAKDWTFEGNIVRHSYGMTYRIIFPSSEEVGA